MSVNMDKQEALKQIETIKNAVVNKGYIMPDSPGHYFVWAILSGLGVTLDWWACGAAKTFETSYETVAGAYFALMIVVGFGASGWFYSKELQKSDHVCTPQLRALRTIYLCSIGFSSILSMAMLKSQAAVFIYGLWIFAIGFSMYVENVISKRFFKNLGLALVSAAALYTLCGYMYLVGGATEYKLEALNFVGKIVSLAFLPGVFVFLGAKLLIIRRQDV